MKPTWAKLWAESHRSAPQGEVSYEEIELQSGKHLLLFALLEKTDNSLLKQKECRNENITKTENHEDKQIDRSS